MDLLHMQTLELCRPRSVARYLVTVLLFVTAILWGQAPQGEIRLQVKDPSGAPMQASGILQSIGGGAVRDFQTDAQGNVVLGSLPFGQYRVQVSKSGFTTQSFAINVPSAAPVTRAITMAVGVQTAKVDVVSETPLGGTD